MDATDAMILARRAAAACPPRRRGGCGYPMDRRVPSALVTCPRCFAPSKLESGWTGGGLLRAALGSGLARERVDFPPAYRGRTALTQNRQERGMSRE